MDGATLPPPFPSSRFRWRQAFLGRGCVTSVSAKFLLPHTIMFTGLGCRRVFGGRHSTSTAVSSVSLHLRAPPPTCWFSVTSTLVKSCRMSRRLGRSAHFLAVRLRLTSFQPARVMCVLRGRVQEWVMSACPAAGGAVRLLSWLLSDVCIFPFVVHTCL